MASVWRKRVTRMTNGTPQPVGKNSHQGQPILTAGLPVNQARAAMILVHGRGGTAADILTLADEFKRADFAYFAPQAANNTWYPNRFMDPIETNEPWLSSALGVLTYLLGSLNGAGMPPERTMLLGFSQGACLTLEFAARNARRFGGLFGLSGGLIGPDGTPRDYAGSLDGTPVFLGCSDVDSHIPKARVVETGDLLEGLGANVTLRLYPQMGHTVNLDEINAIRDAMAALAD